MNGVIFPEGMRLESLQRSHPRREFDCGQDLVNDWLQTRALQHQEKRLSTTKALLDAQGVIVGFYTLAVGQIDFADLPSELSRTLPRRMLPAAVLAWLGVARAYQGRQLGDRLLAHALRDCHLAGETFAFVAVILDCLDDRVKAFYERWNFVQLPGEAHRLFLSAKSLAEMMSDT